MNINSTSSSVDNVKVTGVTKATGQPVQQGESGENSGFLSKLSALLFGSSPEGSDSEMQSSAPLLAEDTDVTENGKLPANALNVAADDETLASADRVDGDEVNTQIPALQKSAMKEVPENVQRSISDESDNEQALSNKSQQVMNDGDALIGRLKEANQALAARNGKTLPPSAVQSEKVDVSLAAAEQHSVDNETGLQFIDNGHNGDGDVEKLSQLAAASAEGADRTEQVDTEQVDTESVDMLTDEQKAQLAVQALASGGTSLADADKSMPPQSASERSVPVTSQPSRGDKALLATATQSAAVTGSEANTPDMLKAEAGNVTVSAVSVPRGQAVAEMDMSNAQVAAANGADGADKVKPTIHNLTASAAQGVTNPLHAAQPGAANSPSPLTQESAPLQMTSAASQAVLNPALNSALNSQTQNLTPAALKASLEATGLGKVDSRKDGVPGQDSSLAHQVAAAAGQQNVTPNTQSLRAEQLQPQPQMPMHLSKEMDVDDMAQRVQMMMSKNLKQIDIRLDPPELGRLHIRMNMHADGTNVQFTVANHQARDALEHSMPRLREMLAQQGVQLADTSVQQQSSGQQQRYTAGGGEQSGHSSASDALGGEENLDTGVKLDLNVAAKRDGISYYA